MIFTYLYFCDYFRFPSANEYENCEINTHLYCRNFNLNLMFPIIAFRITACVTYRYKTSIEFEVPQFLIRILYINIYSMITFMTLIETETSEIFQCWRYNTFNISLLNFTLIYLIGLFIMFICLPITTICIPMLIYRYYQNFMEFLAFNKAKKERMSIIRNLLSNNYTAELFPDRTECAICLQVFEENGKCSCIVTMLPCEGRHCFHTKCIKKWLNKDNVCPYCRDEITNAKCIELKRKKSGF